MPTASIAVVAAVLDNVNWGRSLISLRVLRRKRVYGHHPGEVQDERPNAANRDRRRRGARELGVAGYRWARPISLAEAVVLVERVNDAAMRGAREPRSIDRAGRRAHCGHCDSRVPQAAHALTLRPTLALQALGYGHRLMDSYAEGY